MIWLYYQVFTYELYKWTENKNSQILNLNQIRIVDPQKVGDGSIIFD